MNVIRLKATKSRQKVAAFHQEDENRAAIMDRLSHEIWNRDVDMLSQATKLSMSTLWNIAQGKTQWPRPKTMFTLLRHFNLRMTLINRKDD